MQAFFLFSPRFFISAKPPRLLIARAIVSKPSILFFDEAASALDDITRKAISDAPGEMPCTRIVIAHRLSAVQNGDRILVLDGGHIVEEGSYKKLMRLDGRFAAPVRNQPDENRDSALP